MRIALEPAYILHRRPYRNTSLLLEAFSRDHGRVGLIARGVRSRPTPRSPRGRWRGLLEPFTPVLLSWSGRGELPTLTGAEASAPVCPMPANRLLSGLYLNELLLRLLPRSDPHPDLFAAYGRVLSALAGQSRQEVALRVFEKHLLAELGYGLLLDRDSRGIAIDPTGHYRYDTRQGPVPDTPDNSGPMVAGDSLLALHHETLESVEQLRQIKRLTRAAIAAQLEDRPLQTRELAAVYRRAAAEPSDRQPPYP